MVLVQHALTSAPTTTAGGLAGAVKDWWRRGWLLFVMRGWESLSEMGVGRDRLDCRRIVGRAEKGGQADWQRRTRSLERLG